MGKSGKLRKKRRLENAVGVSALPAVAQTHVDVDTDSSDDDGDEALLALSRNRKTTTIDPLNDSYVENAIACLDYYGKSIESYQSSECKVVRAALFPLLEEQKSKVFDPAMKTAGNDSSDDEEEASFDLPTAILTFRALSSNMEVFRSKDMKPLRRALNPIVRATRCALGAKDHGINLSGEISNALNLRQWKNVFDKLLDMKRAAIVPKLGALQRWVRLCGDITPKELAIFMLSRVIDLTAHTTLSESDVPRLLASFKLYSEEGSGSSSGAEAAQILYMPPFVAPHRAAFLAQGGVDAPSLLNSPYPVVREHFPVHSCVEGKDRRPPSDIDMNVYQCTKDAIVFDRKDSDYSCACFASSSSSSTSSVKGSLGCDQCHGVHGDAVEGVPGALLLSNVLSPSECAQLIEAAEMLGYYDDAVEGIDALVWVAHESLLRPIFDRCKKLLPQVVANGKKVAGINPRLRFFRYGQGAVYRPHIDGSWTASGDASLESSDTSEIRSHHTFLIYLNGGFSGGGTTFFVPPDSCGAASSEKIVARSVQPTQGSILLFPHGVVEGSLVHEGSAVEGDGKKYVIRTDLMFA